MGTPKKKTASKTKGKFRDLQSKKNPKGGFDIEQVVVGRRSLNPQPLPP